MFVVSFLFVLRPGELANGTGDFPEELSRWEIYNNDNNNKNNSNNMYISYVYIYI